MDANKDTATEGSEKINRNSDVAPVAGNAADEGELPQRRAGARARQKFALRK
jgi:hypothetical protein